MHDFNHVELCMGTGFRFQGKSNISAAETDHAIEIACAILHEADAIFSLYKPESPLSQLAAGKTSVARCPSVVSEVWDACEAWQEKTDGWFSAFTPEHTFDPSGLVKTWAARRAAESLTEAGITDFTMNAGGDVYIADQASAEVDWRIGLSKPVSIAAPEAGALAVLNLKGTEYRAVATSGSAERGAHIWNPKAPGREPAGELVQISVIARDLVEADIWATAAFAEGLASMARIDREPHLEALAILADGQMAATPGLAALIAKD
ncbi:MAG: FAD:protein FMN transferase [Rhodoluna sp.]|nr:FAD:protein FMN transferase [Rhodoluna sp.]MBP6186477.1 FAD:protein FMN transferase [Rhodoluna sp.]